jgi:hypothetical protein
LPEKTKLYFGIHIEGGFVIEGETMALTLTAVQQVGVSVSAVDAKGNPAQVEDVVFSSSDEAVLLVKPDTSDPHKATAVAVAVGTAQVKVQADADIGEGVTNLTGLLDIEVVAAEAVSLGMTAGTPEDQPAEGEVPMFPGDLRPGVENPIVDPPRPKGRK